MRLVLMSLSLALLVPAAAEAQSETMTVKAIADSSLALFRSPRTNILRAAEKMPEENYSFRPTPDVRSFGELLGHIADGYTLVCTLALGQKPPVDIQQTEKTKKTKAELIQALTASGDACDKAHATLSGARDDARDRS